MRNFSRLTFLMVSFSESYKMIHIIWLIFIQDSMNWATLEYVEIFKMFVELIGGQSLEKMSIQWWISWLHYLFGYVVNLTVGLYFLRRREKHESHHWQSIVGDPLSCLTEWQLLLTMYFAIGSIDISRLSPSDAVLRIFEVAIQFSWAQKNFFSRLCHPDSFKLRFEILLNNFRSIFSQT